jgi:chemotaxis protein CheX
MLEITDQPIIQLVDNLDLKAARPLHSTLLSHRHGPVVIDASRVQRLGGLCLQVLLSAKASWVSDGDSFCFRAASPAFVDALGLLGAKDLQSLALAGLAA